jgi:hypothetical protein
MRFCVADDSDRNDWSSRPSRRFDEATPVKWSELVSLIEGLIERVWTFGKYGDESRFLEQRRDVSSFSKSTVLFDG